MQAMNRSNNNNRRVYVGNLPSNIDERDLEDIFYKYGDISDVDLKIPRYGTGGTPFAFVEFHDPRCVRVELCAPCGLRYSLPIEMFVFRRVIISVRLSYVETWFRFQKRFDQS